MLLTLIQFNILDFISVRMIVLLVAGILIFFVWRAMRGTEAEIINGESDQPSVNDIPEEMKSSDIGVSRGRLTPQYRTTKFDIIGYILIALLVAGLIALAIYKFKRSKTEDVTVEMYEIRQQAVASPANAA
ncbi:hypothetical protein ACFLQJ_01600 [Calditrichota bacterium]